MAYAGFDDGFLALPRSWGASERARRISALIEAGQPWVVRDLNNDADYPYREEARKRGYGSMIALPLRVEGQLVGALHILAAEADAFDDKEMELLVATANDLGYGLGALRARARAAEAEATIKRMTHFDAVTGLPNRVRLRDLLAEAIASAKEDMRPLRCCGWRWSASEISTRPSVIATWTRWCAKLRRGWSARSGLPARWPAWPTVSSQSSCPEAARSTRSCALRRFWRY